MKRKREEPVADERFIEITTKGVKIFPTNMKKYHGSAYKMGKRWQTDMRTTKERFLRMHDTLAEAEQYVKDMNKANGYEIKNILYTFNDEYYCVLPRFQTMKFSFQDFEIVEKYVWHVGSNDKNILTLADGKSISFKSMLFPSLGADQQIKFMNDDIFDFTRENLQIISKNVRNYVEPDAEFLEVTSKGVAKYPKNRNKYLGQVIKYDNKWKSFFQGEYKYIPRKLHDSREEAELHIRQESIDKKLPIKNIVYEYNDVYYCILTNNQMMKFSPEDMDLVDNYTWYAFHSRTTKGYYAKAEFEGKCKHFTNFIFPARKEKETIDHISRVSLDNRRENLRIASPEVQAINQRMKGSNKSGVSGVNYHKSSKCWTATWTDENKKPKTKSFTVQKHGYDAAFEMACKRRETEINKIQKYQIALNLQV
jgi:hypothetical protein